MDYFGILKKAYHITFKYRYLWLLGLLAGLTGSNWNFAMPSSSSDNGTFEKIFSGNNTASNIQWDQILGNYWGLIFSLIGLFLVLGLIWYILSIISQGGLLGSVAAIEKDQKVNFRFAFTYGWHKFWKVFAVGLLIGLAIITSIIVLVLPVILFVLAKIYVLAIIYGILVFFLDMIFWLFIGLNSPYIMRNAVLGGKGSWEAITTSWNFFKLHWKEIFIMYLLLMAVGICLTLGLILTFLLIGGLLTAIGFAIYLASQFWLWIYIGIFATVLVVLFLVIGGMISAFNSAVLTLTYLELAKKS